jgi:hypothetical protein
MSNHSTIKNTQSFTLIQMLPRAIHSYVNWKLYSINFYKAMIYYYKVLFVHINILLLGLFSMLYATAATIPSNVSSTIKKNECINCPSIVSACEEAGPTGKYCKVVSETCNQHSCSELSDIEPTQPHKAYQSNYDDIFKPCIQCFWRPTCAVALCPVGTICREIAPTCHSCGTVECIPIEPTQ